jgi:cobalt-precorrin 5A hydrolase
MKLAILSITTGGKRLAEKLARKLPDTTILARKSKKTAGIVADNWPHFDGFIFIMAAGIAVRAIAPLLLHKHKDPCVVVMDEKGQHVISLLSGHIGGGNKLAVRLAAITGGVPVITTASDTLGLLSLDLWAKNNNLVPENQERLTEASAKLVNEKKLSLYTDLKPRSLPEELLAVANPELADVIVSHQIFPESRGCIFRPRNLVVGTGCNRGTPANEFEESLCELLEDKQLSRLSIRNLASIDKKNDEEGLLFFAKKNNWPIDFFTKDEINSLKTDNLDISSAALKAVGAIGVAEPTALLSGRTQILLCRKRKWKNITMAIALAPFTLSARVRDQNFI